MGGIGSPSFVESSRAWRYGIAALSVGIAAVLWRGLDPLLDTSQVLFAFTVAVTAAARIGGRGSGLLATALSIPLARFFFVEPRFSFAIANPRDLVSLVVLAGAGVGIGVLLGRARTSPTAASEPRGAYSALRQMLLFGSPLLVLVVLTRLLYDDFEREKDRQQWVTQSYQVLNAVGALLSNLQDAETGQRGYLLTGDESYREPFESAAGREQSIRLTLGQLVGGNPAQQVNLVNLDRLMNSKFAELRKTMELRQSQGPVAALAVVRDGEGQRLMNECRAILGAMEEQDRELLAKRTGAAHAGDVQMRWVLGLGSSGLLMLLVIAGTAIERDTGTRQQAEEALRAREQDLRHFAEFAPVSIAMFDLEMRYLAASRRYRVELSLSEELIGRSHYEVFPEIPPHWREIHQRCLRGAVECHPGERFERADGRLQWLRWEIQPWHQTDGRIGGIVLFSEDITSQKEAAQALWEASQQRRLAMEAAKLGAWDYHFETGDVFWDVVCRRMFGVTAGGQIAYDDAISRIHSDDRLAVDEAVRLAIGGSQGGVFHGEFRTVWPDGSVHWVSSHGQVDFEPDSGRPVHFNGLNMDITGRKQAELESLQLNLQLEQRVLQRTEQLEAANRELEAFAYSVSHDLRAPLRGIDGWSLALAEDYAGQLDERAQGYVERVRSETRRMGLLIDDLLGLSRVARAEMYFVPVDLTSAARKIAEELQEAHPDRKIDFAIETGLTGMGDARLLGIALTNLLANAVKFTGPRAEARIEVGRGVHNGQPAFHVRDNGVGFDMAHAERLFRPFQRLHLASQFPGSGIGLATVQRVIHRHAGQVAAEGRVDGGATFYFTIGEGG